MHASAPSDRSPGDADGRTEAEDAAARRYLDLWERQLTYLAMRGPAPRAPAPDSRR